MGSKRFFSILVSGLLLFSFTVLGSTGCDQINNKLSSSQMNKQVNFPFGIRQGMGIEMTPESLTKATNDTLQFSTPVERQSEEGRYQYFVQKDNSRVYVRYSSEENTVIDIWGMEKVLKESNFSALKPGTSTSQDVYKIDSYVTIIINKDNKDSAYSQHRLQEEDGKLLTVNYEKNGENWQVASVEVAPDPSNFFTVIQSEDLPA